MTLSRLIIFIAGTFFALDFRSEAGAYFDEILSLLACIFSACYLLVQKRLPIDVLVWLLPFALLIFVGTLRGLVGDQTSIELIVSLLPILIFSVSTIVFAVLAKREDRLFLLKLVCWISLIAAISTFAQAYIINSNSYDLQSIRWRMLHLSLIVLFAFGLCGMLYMKVYLFRFCLMLSISVIFLSLTRTYLVCFVLMLLLAMLTVPGRKRLGTAVMSVGFIFVFSSLLYLNLEVASAWQTRLISLSSTGVDLTLATRLAEAEYQLSLLSATPINALLGLGFGAESGYGGFFADIVYATLGEGSIEDKGISGFGHNMYLGFVYVGGIFGLFCIFRLITLFYASVKIVMNHMPLIGAGTNKLLFICMLSLGGILTYGLAAGMFNIRSSGFVIGMICGLLLSLVNELKQLSKV